MEKPSFDFFPQSTERRSIKRDAKPDPDDVVDGDDDDADDDDGDDSDEARP